MSSSSPLKVLLVANTLPPVDLSGAGEQVVQLAWGLRRKGQEVEILGRGEGGVPGPKLLFPFTAAWWAWRRVRRWSPDVVQVHESDGGLVLVLLRLLRWMTGRRFLLVALQQVSYHEERRAVRPLVDRDSGSVLGLPTRSERRFRFWRTPIQAVLGRWSARGSDLVLAPSRQTASELERDYGVRGVEVLHNVTGAPIDRGGTQPDGVDAPSTADDYLLFVGRLRIRKGVEVLLSALAAALEKEPTMRLVVAGDGERASLLRTRAEELSLSDRVVFVGRRSSSEVRALLAGARALVVPSTYEGMPLVILEAMEAGVPVVASAVSGIPEVVVDGESGWLVPPEDSRRLVSVLVDCWQDREEAARRGEAGRARLERLYRPEAAARQWLELVSARIDRKDSE